MPFVVATATASASCENDPNAVTPASSAAAMTARAPSARSSGLASAVRAEYASGRGSGAAALGRPGQSSSSLTLAAIIEARSTSERMPSASMRPVFATPIRQPFTNRRLTYTSADGDVLVDLGVREPGQRALAADDERLRLVRAGGLCRLDHALGEPQRVVRVTADAVRRAHATTPTRTLRNRAPDTPCPTWPVCPGSPLPQFGVPHIRHELASPTASIDRHSSYVMPV